MGSEVFTVPSGYVCFVESYDAMSGFPDSDEHTCEGGLPGGTLPDDGDIFAFIEMEVKVLKDGFFDSRRHPDEMFDIENPLRFWEGHRFFFFREVSEELIESVITSPSPDKASPSSDGLFDGSKSPSHDDGTCDHGPWGDDLVESEVGSDSEDSDLETDSEGFGGSE